MVQTGAIDGNTSWDAVLEDVDTVVHSAGVVHKTKKDIKNGPSEYWRVNVAGTERLALSCARMGVRRFIFVSSIGANGEFTDDKPFTEDDILNPIGAYAVSKREAENVLLKVAGETGMEVVILRPPLVYGPGVKANFKNLMKLASSGLPLPFGGIDNRRSFIYLGNLVDAIELCIDHRMAAGETFLVSDGQDVSTPDLIKMIASAMSKRPFLFSMHMGILRTMCKIAGKTEELDKMTGSLMVDSGKIRRLLGWKPPFTLEEGVRETVKGYDKKDI